MPADRGMCPGCNRLVAGQATAATAAPLKPARYEPPAWQQQQRISIYDLQRPVSTRKSPAWLVPMVTLVISVLVIGLIALVLALGVGKAKDKKDDKAKDKNSPAHAALVVAPTFGG